MNGLRSPEEIRAELVAELGKKRVDTGRLLKLAAELSRHDTDSMAFSVNATIVRRLGRELVSARETALAELVKNSYDADATKVSVVISSLDKPGGRLVIEDNGEGMTFDQVRDGFLRISSDEKERSPLSAIYKRKRAGQKGIGRFAVERLGKRLLLVTTTRTAQDAIQVDIDWNRFEESGDIGAIRNPVARVPKAFTHGTRLIIDGLREGWSITSLQETQSYLNDLLEPSYFETEVLTSLDDESAAPGGAVGQEFLVTFNVLKGATPQVIQTAERDLIVSALAIVTAEVERNSDWNIAIKSALLGKTWNYDLTTIPDSEKAAWSFRDLKNIRLQAAYYIWDEEIVESLNLKHLRKLITQRAGIRVYRNGFRVPPYGDPGNDWLGLDKAQSQREILVAIGNKSWLGYIRILDPENRLIVETSSREGLVRNRFYDELRTFAKSSLRLCAIAIGRSRGKKVFTSEPAEFGQTKVERARLTVQRLAKQIRQLTATRHSKISTIAKEAQTDATIAEFRLELEQLVKDTTDLVGEMSILRVLASVGMSVLMFSHEVKGVLVAMLAQIDVLLADDGVTQSTSGKLKTLKELLLRLQHHTSFYEATGAAAAARDRLYTDMLAAALNFVETFKAQALRRAITLHFEGGVMLPPQRVAIHEAEFSAILINLYTNAVKAIERRRGLTHRRITIATDELATQSVLNSSTTALG